MVVTGGPGAGKTAVLEMLRRTLCPHVVILPEAASIIFKGGFWRRPSVAGRRASQRAIFHVQHELEQLVEDEGNTAIALCDRGSLDGLAYWPGSHATYFKQLKTTYEYELFRYEAIIHLETPSKLSGYDHSNPVRVEDAHQAHLIDKKLKLVWSKHPNRYFVKSTVDFMEKARLAINLIEQILPHCCGKDFGHASQE
ncbi:MAG: ATP-binding protein [Myxococcales bacterium]|nr:MAG: ATP-binding protein [Myxococcales bacterium]